MQNYLNKMDKPHPDFPERALADASKKVLDAVFTTDVVQENRRLHRLMVEGVKATYVEKRRRPRSSRASCRLEWPDQ